MNHPPLRTPSLGRTLAVALCLSAAVTAFTAVAHARQQQAPKKAASPATSSPLAGKFTTAAHGATVLTRGKSAPSAPGKPIPSQTTARRAAKKPAPAVAAPHHRRGLANLARLAPSGATPNSTLRSASKLGPSGKMGTSPLDRWSMTRHKQTARSWKKANERDNRGRSVLPDP